MFRTIYMLLAITLTAGLVAAGATGPVVAAEQTDNGGFGIGGMQSDSYAAFSDPQSDMQLDPSAIEPAAGEDAGVDTGAGEEFPVMTDTPSGGFEKTESREKPID